MAMGGRAYVVRADSEKTETGNVDKLYPYTLRGLTDALADARFRSAAGSPQVIVVIGEESSRIIRRYERGREVPA
jgi:hypothetical protein